MNSNVVYSIVVPVFNEELVINETYKRLKYVMDSLNESYEIIFVNDGSKDKSGEILKNICNKDKNIKLISFSRNFGHQVAITAGIDYSSGSAVIIIDADLQDPPEIIPKMTEKWKEGYHVVYGKRIKRNGESFFKRFTAKAFYRILRMMTDINIPVDTGDFRLMDRKVCDALKSIPEKNRYVRGLVSWIGFKQTGVEFVREGRFAGETKYPLKKMLKFAFDGITSFSYKPLKLATYIGTIISVLSFFYLVVVIIEKLFTNFTVKGWTSIVALNLFFNGLMFIMIGIIGEYIGRIYDEAKGRPLYIVDEKEGF
ncbi:glycosyltransferase family 2 protein [Caldicellulosiruptoraceae bacterium PP1]